MAIFDSTARRQLPAEPTYRAPPHNIEAEQALLGAILVNNEAFYRVSDFL
ncbi:MAG TPA: DnaB-like helicase N-terminal domain-containing protein, partial [Xanthobacteraceae bacterium]|nr:DnaB-like helicase N-terminal domain-containing protein [Xanthobacteraceae bacterium]